MTWDHVFLNTILVVLVPIVAGREVAAFGLRKRVITVLAYTGATFLLQVLYLNGRFEGAELFLRAGFIALLPLIAGVAYLNMPERWK